MFERQDIEIAWDGARMAGIMPVFLGAWRLQWSWPVTSIMLSAVMAAAYVALYVVARRLITRRMATAAQLV